MENESPAAAPTPETTSASNRSKLATVGLVFLELVRVAFVAGLTIGLIRYFLFKPFYVKGQSMEPNYTEHDYLIIDELSYRLREPVRGEVIVLKAPTVEKDYYLKRIIGLPGERVRVENNQVMIYNRAHSEGVVIEEIYEHEPTAGTLTMTLGPNQYFVLGDNREASFDSRRFGPISREAIVGRTWLRGWPLSRMQLFSSPAYNL